MVIQKRSVVGHQRRFVSCWASAPLCQLLRTCNACPVRLACDLPDLSILAPTQHDSAGHRVHVLLGMVASLAFDSLSQPSKHKMRY